MIKLIFLGSRFWNDAYMPDMIDEEGGTCTWFDVSNGLENGESYQIRPATIDELAHYEPIYEERKKIFKHQTGE